MPTWWHLRLRDRSRVKWFVVKNLFHFRNVNQKWRGVIDNDSQLRKVLFMEPIDKCIIVNPEPRIDFCLSYEVHYHQYFGKIMGTEDTKPPRSHYLWLDNCADDGAFSTKLHPILDNIPKWGEMVHLKMMDWRISSLGRHEPQSLKFYDTNDLKNSLRKCSRYPSINRDESIWMNINQWCYVHFNGGSTFGDRPEPPLTDEVYIDEKSEGEGVRVGQAAQELQDILRSDIAPRLDAYGRHMLPCHTKDEMFVKDWEYM
ncbi:hypothetical protein BU23DRAFT_629613 [Bimuria novae-zelandiae CBS 107.79]|uniref:F-box domain-containing protein n=1 Tax=Bimuria novae-zelandiae CBS 107.79 TaxID=1447943 RepID=A0A6A5UM81_9PLEO|nr:hypothetical protein BU23DRAFT_629613 [Bimuria novae-zelandiae CBS 107.79]